MEHYQKTKPFEHQTECLEMSKDRDVFAIFLEQGLGKTKIVIDNVAYLFDKGSIDGLLILAPNGVHSNWIRREIPIHLHDNIDTAMLEFSSTKSTTKRWQAAYEKLIKYPDLSILAMNIEALSASQRAAKIALDFVDKRHCMIVIDESSRIKNPSSKRTKRVFVLGKKCRFKRILTGTPVTQSPFDLFAQFKFLSPEILGYQSFYAFKHNYGVFTRKVITTNGKTHSFDDLLRYIRLDDLKEKIKHWSYRRTKVECTDIPNKIYQVVSLDMSKEQKKLYDKMDEDGVLEFEDFDILAPAHIVKLLRLQQITGGFIPVDDDNPETGISIPGVNPKLNYLLDDIAEGNNKDKIIIWARFRYEIKLISDNLREQHGAKSIVEFHGGVGKEARQNNIDRFQNDDTCRFIVGQQASGIGITLTAATRVIYYSNTFSYEQRFQSEDRCHRIGTKYKVLYTDLVMNNAADERVMVVLKMAKGRADEITGDNERVKKFRREFNKNKRGTLDE